MDDVVTVSFDMAQGRVIVELARDGEVYGTSLSVEDTRSLVDDLLEAISEVQYIANV